jgi:Tfp pilus assembly protein PilE
MKQKITSLLPLITSLLVVVFLIASVAGILMDSSVKKSAPKLTAAQIRASLSSSGSSTNSNVSSKLQGETLANLSMIQTMLQSYFSNNSYYPSDLSPTQLINQSGNFQISSNGVTESGQQLASIFTPPAGVKYVYSATPSGCTTASKTCQNYILKAIQTSNGAVINSVSSQN